MLRINDDAPNFTAETRKARSTSMNGLATAGQFCFRIPRTSLRSAPPNSATWRDSSRNSQSATARSSA